jgi:hypothetical protein
VIALTPEAAYERRARQLPYYALEAFFDVRAFLEADEAMLQLQGAWADRVDEYAWNAIPALADVGLRPAGNYFFFLKCLSDNLYRCAFGLAHLLLAAGAARLVHFPLRRNDRIGDDLFFAGLPYCHVLPACAQAYGATVTCPGTGPGGLFSGGGIPAAGARLRRAGAALRKRSHSFGRPWEALYAGAAGEVIYQGGYDVALVADCLRDHRYQTTELETLLSAAPWSARGAGTRLTQDLAELWPALAAERFFGEPFRWVGMDLQGIAAPRLEHWWLSVVPRMWRTLVRARRRFQCRPPKALVLSSPTTPEEHGLLQAARACGVPTLSYQHGGFEGNCDYNTYAKTDLRLADYRLVYGDGTAAYLNEIKANSPEPLADVVPVGSARLDAVARQPVNNDQRVRRRMAVVSGRPLVLYVASGHQPTSWYLCRGAYLGVPYFQLLTRVVEVMRRHRDIQFIFRPFPERPVNPIVALLEDVPNVMTVRDRPMAELMQSSDAQVIDIPSTALLEALLGSRRILAYADRRFVSLRSGARGPLARRVTLAETPDAFIASLEAFLSAERFEEIDAPDRSFLRLYGTHVDDGGSTRRAARAVELAMTRGPRSFRPSAPDGIAGPLTPHAQPTKQTRM